MHKPRTAVLLAATALALLAAPASAEATAVAARQVTLSTQQGSFLGGPNQGFWSGTVDNTAGNPNYFAGSTSDGGRIRDFFTFDLRDVPAPITAATLLLDRGQDTAPLSFRLSDVSTPAGTLNDTDGTSAAIYRDLGTGTSYGTFAIRGDAPQTGVRRLNDAGVAALNAGRGGFVSFGGSVVGRTGRAFAGTGQDPQHLVLTLR